MFNNYTQKPFMMKKKRIVNSLAACFFGLMLNAQEATTISGDLHVLANGNIAFHGDVTVTGTGTLQNTGGTLYTLAGSTGEEYIQLSATANLYVDGGAFTFKNETNEAITNLTIGNSGKVIVPPGNSLTVTGDLDNSSADTGIYLLADATGYAQLLASGGVLNRGTLYAEQYLTAQNTEGWRQLSSPVTATLAQFDDDFLIYYPAAPGTVGRSDQWNVQWYDARPVGNSVPGSAGPNPHNSNSPAANNGVHHSSANAKHWTYLPNNSTTIGPMNDGIAVNLYTGGAFSILDSGVLDVAGLFGHGDYSYGCYSTHDIRFEQGKVPLETNQLLVTGWNLIPNPYPCNLDLGLLLGDAANFDLNYKAVHVWDARNQQYVAITDDINNAIDWNTGDSLNNMVMSSAHNIGPFQAFWVKADYTNPGNNPNATENIVLRNAHRTVEATMNTLKTTPPVIALRTWDDDNIGKDQALVAFDASYDLAIENRDAIKFFSSNPEVPAVATMAEGVNLSINRLPLPAPSHSIPVNFASQQNGKNYHVGLGLQDINPNWTIYLEDRKTATMTNMRTNSRYSFVHDGAFAGNRFVLHINKFAGNVNPERYNHVSIYGNDDGINVAFANPQHSTAEIIISNLAGQTFYQGTVSTGTLFTFPINDDVAMYVVRVVTGERVFYEKIVK